MSDGVTNTAPVFPTMVATLQAIEQDLRPRLVAMSGDIGEVQIWNAPLMSEETRRVQKYLLRRWQKAARKARYLRQMAARRGTPPKRRQRRR